MNMKREELPQVEAPTATDLGRRRFIAGLGASAAIVSSGTLMRPAGAQVPLNIGVLLPVSGVQAALGLSSKRGADIAASVLSELGYKAPIRLMHADIESNVDVARCERAQGRFGLFPPGGAGGVARRAGIANRDPAQTKMPAVRRDPKLKPSHCSRLDS